MLARLSTKSHIKLVSHSIRCFSSKGSLMEATPEQVVAEMERNKQHRAYFIYNPKTQQVQTSHPMWDECATRLKAHARDYHAHEGIFLEIGPQSRALLSAVVHNTTRGQGAGGVRYWPYPSFFAFLCDGLRLSEGMGRKNALAGLWWGGAKGVIARQPGEMWKNREFRDTLFREYGSFMTSLRGCYVTAEDAGVNTEDMAFVQSRTRFTTCGPRELGGSGNPSIPTGHGVVCAMEGALHHLHPGATLQGKTIAVQGLGNVATPMIAKLFEKGVKHVYASDIHESIIQRATTRFAGLPFTASLTGPGDNTILIRHDVDIVSPCALGGILNERTISAMKPGVIVCGAANNQLLDDQVDDKRLLAHGVTYVPDFLANRMGIVSCADEQFGYVRNDPAIERHFGRSWENSIFVMTEKVLSLAAQKKITTAQAANEIADQLQTKDHPIWPNRSRLIIQGLVADAWATQPSIRV